MELKTSDRDNPNDLLNFYFDDSDRRLLTDADCDIDTCLYDDNETSEEPPASLLEKVENSPKQYRICRMRITSATVAFAEVCNKKEQIFYFKKYYSERNDYFFLIDEHEKYKLRQLTDRGRSFDGDLVVIKLSTKSLGTFGIVSGILERKFDPKSGSFVCWPDITSIGFLIPLNLSMPKIMCYKPRQKEFKLNKYEIPIYDIESHPPKFSKKIKVKKNETDKCLFLVKFLKWEKGYTFPIGVVFKKLTFTDNKQFANEILKYEFNTETIKLIDRVEQQINKELFMFKNFNDEITESMNVYKNRTNLTSNKNFFVFTIDPPNATVLDDAISVEEIDDITYIGVHIADVSHFVKKDSHMDRIAKENATSMSNNKRTIIKHMIPHDYLRNLCSLQPNKNRLATSIRISVKDLQIIDIQGPIKTIIRSKYQFSYEEVECYLTTDTADQDQYIKENLRKLNEIIEKIRFSRLGNQYYANLDKPSDWNCSNARHIVEELALTCNKYIADLLSEKEICFPIRRQLEPDIYNWKLENSCHAKFSFQLNRFFQPFGIVCKCHKECECLDILQTNGDQVLILTDIWNKIRNTKNINKVEKMLTYIRNFPKQQQAFNDLISITDKAEYDVYPTFDDKHFRLNFNIYTQFTSPIRRYIDLVVQRILFDEPYTKEEIIEISKICTNNVKNANKFKETSRLYEVASVLNESDYFFDCIFDKFNELTRSIEFDSSNFSGTITNFNSIPFSSLCLWNQPKIISDDKKVKFQLNWKQRIYSLSSNSSTYYVKTRHNNPVTLKEKNLIAIPGDFWNRILNCIKNRNIEDLQNLINQPIHTFERLSNEVTSEVPSNERIDYHTKELKPLKTYQHYVFFQMNLSPGDVIKIQMGSEWRRGLLIPKAHYMELTPKHGICLQHVVNPIQCFADDIHATVVKKQSYLTIKKYQELWLPVIQLESCITTISNHDDFIIQNVFIEWVRYDYTGNENFRYMAEILFDFEFFEERQFNIAKFDFVCIRYANNILFNLKPFSDDKNDNNINLEDLSANKYGVFWIAHGKVSEIKMYPNPKTPKKVSIHIELCTMLSPFPEILLSNQEHMLATLQFLHIPLPERRKQNAILELSEFEDDEENLVKKIILDRIQIEGMNLIDEHFGKIKRNMCLNKPNASQKAALEKAISQTFTLIQGPPGTGKTETSAHLIYNFVMLNENGNQNPVDQDQTLSDDIDSSESELSDDNVVNLDSKKVKKLKDKNIIIRNKVLYCGPSNKSVDVVMEYLVKTKIKFIRMFGNTIERSYYPLPYDIDKSSGDKKTIDEKWFPYTLHEIIRIGDDDYASKIRDFERRFREYIEEEKLMENDDNYIPQCPEITKEDVLKYQKLVTKAKLKKIKNCQVLLTTCINSATPLLKMLKNEKKEIKFKQIIIDECGMASEPDCLVPLVAHNPKQIVLVGDHKQLQPIVLCREAKLAGLNFSMFERLVEKKHAMYMLEEQYRMHKSIASFPSEHFYENKLKSTLPWQNECVFLPEIWPNKKCAFAFLNCVGKEETQIVATSEAGEMSKSNIIEVEQCIRIARELTRKGVEADKIVILTYYRAQIIEFENRIENIPELKPIHVQTIITSQGSEYDYVILSCVRTINVDMIQKDNRFAIQNAIGFVADEHQLNVAITRAKYGLMIVGNTALLRCTEHWRQLIEFYTNYRAIINVESFLESNED